MLKAFALARKAGAPLVVIRTADPSATVAAILQALPGIDQNAAPPVLRWDAARGIAPVNKAGEAELKRSGIKSEDTVDFVAAMLAAALIAKTTILFAFNAHRQLRSQEPIATAAAMQAVANLRDQFKVSFRMLCLVGPEFQVPPELEHDVVTIDQPLPDADELKQIVAEIYQSAKYKVPKDLTKHSDALAGVTAFAAETAAAMSLTEEGMDVGTLWDRKRQKIGDTPGLSVWAGKERFSDIVGCEAVKAKLRQRLNARTPIGVVVWIDEIDKALANVEHDTSGVRTYQLLKLLTEMENNEWPGIVAAGVAGAGKSLLAKSLGNEAGVPTIALDLGASESKYVGESEGNLNRIIAIIKAVGRGHAYFVATSNAATVMRPELQRRFRDGMWMFDLPSAEEREAAWAFYMKRYGLPAQAIPADDAWTGAEIRNCCQAAWDSSITLVEAAQFIIPMATSRADEIDRLRSHANGKFLDAARPGSYRYDPAPMAASLRAIATPGSGVAH